MLNLPLWLPAVWIVRDAVVAVGNAVAVDIAVPFVSYTISIKITVRTIKARLTPLIARSTRIVDIGDAIAVAVRAAALPMLPVMAPIVVGCRHIDWPGLHIYARHLNANRKVHVTAGVRR